ncbi:MAG TPA: DUF885 family protein [Chthonomonadaceae bacterium]|nr:DUF885 family protein [Chthonomonadaceae bacterium]
MPTSISLSEFTPTTDRVPALLARFHADRESLKKLFDRPYSPQRRERLRAFYAEWQEMLEALPFAELTRSDRADAILFEDLLHRERRHLEQEEARFAEMEPLLPFALDLIAMEEARRRLEDIDAAIAERLDRADRQLKDTRKALEAKKKKEKALPKPAVAHRAAQTIDGLLKTLEKWHAFYEGYDPLYTWWVERPYRALETSLKDYNAFLRKELAGAEDQDAIIGDPVGREAIEAELEEAFLAYSPEELILLAQREMDWCRGQMRAASQEMGLGDDWRAAVERIKSLHVPPGRQPALVRDLALEAIRYVQDHDLLTVPPLAAECWRMEMLSPERQKVSPFFLGGETIMVSYPAQSMEHPQKQMSLRGNNRHFSRATVQHELIPGHRMQAFFQERYRPYRRIFTTPFWTEGWTLYWEMLLWDLGFAQSPEDRIGMLFWRTHRCARVVFSLRFHLEQMTAQECVEMLVNEVGHEPDNAEAEVRRSVNGDYHPLYQCAYLIGGMQVYALQKELTGSGRLSLKAFHDAMMKENCMPIAVLRALLADLPLERPFPNDWRFAGPPPA